MEKDYVTPVLVRFVVELGIPVTRQTVFDELQRHTESNSLYAFSDLLNKWNVPNAAYQVQFDKLAQLSTPFIAHVSNKEFAVVTAFTEKHVTVFNTRWKNKKFTVNEFKVHYTGSILIAEKEEDSGEPDYAQKRRIEISNNLRMPVITTGMIITLLTSLLLYSNYFRAFNLHIALLTFLKTTGLSVSVLLLIQSIDSNNLLIQKLCNSGNNKDCNAILSSNAAKITNELSWSEVGFFYFAGTWLTLLFNSSQLAIMQSLAAFSLLSLPYTFYSIYYQWRVAKQWCIFCCMIQALLWLEFLAFLPYLFRGIQTPSLIELITMLMGFMIPVFCWLIVKPLLLQAKQVIPLKQQLDKFKYNPALFNRLLNEENKYELPLATHSLMIGNPEAENIITMVSNPYCQPCAKAHKALDEWMANRVNVKLQVIFNTGNHPQDKKAEVASHLMSLQTDTDHSTLKKALNDWYGQKQKNYEDWAKAHPKTKDVITSEALNKQNQWCTLTEITGTPTLFLNGRKLPKNYQPEDLKYFI
jgi:uncharacterized membrane protein/glutaredoxin